MILGLALIGSLAHGAAIPQKLKNVEQNYSRAKTVHAEFEQTVKVASTKTQTQSSGEITFQLPDKVYWKTLKPEVSELVSDGIYFWQYTPPFDKDDNGQVLVRKASEVSSRFASALFSGDFKSKSIQTITPEGKDGFKIVPKKGTAGDVKSAIIRLDQLNHVSDVELRHMSGNVTSIKLKAIKLGAKVDAKIFHFVPPPKTDIITE